jgi:hypothetical protein
MCSEEIIANTLEHQPSFRAPVWQSVRYHSLACYVAECEVPLARLLLDRYHIIASVAIIIILLLCAVIVPIA